MTLPAMTPENDQPGPLTILADAQLRAGGGAVPLTLSAAHVIVDSEVPRATGFDRLKITEEQLGRGGLGIVYAGEDTLLKRELAIKVLHYSFDQRAIEAFIEEAQITGQLEHPNIVPVHELGFDPAGMPYLAMKRVLGRDLEGLIDETDATIRNALEHDPADAGRVAAVEERRLLEVFERICDAVAYAHSRGVIHRDLKPANVMLGEYGEVLVVDWGLARPIGGKELKRAVLTDRRADHADQTVQGTVMGTPAYMPPEQARGRTSDMDERTDIYSLGAILYDMMTGNPPFSGDAEKVLDLVRTGRVVPPSQQANGRVVPRELEAVVMKAMAFRRADRYGSVAELKAEISAYRDGRALTAVQYSPWDLFWKFAQRHRGAVITAASAAALMLVTVVVFIVSLNVQRTEALSQRDRADAAARNAVAAQDEARAGARRAEAEAKRAESEARRAAGEAAAAEIARSDAERERRDTARALQTALAFKADQLRQNNDLLGAIALLNETHSLPATVTRLALRPPPLIWHARMEAGADADVRTVAMSSDGQFMAAGGRMHDGIHVWRTTDGELVRTLGSGRGGGGRPDGGRGRRGGRMATALDFCPGQPLLACLTAEGDIQLWDLRNQGQAARPEVIQQAHPFGMTFALRFSPDGRSFVTAGVDGLTLWDVATRKQIAQLANAFDAADQATAQAKMMALFSNPDSLQKLMESFQAVLSGRRIAGEELAELPIWSVLDMAFSTDGRTLACACSDRAIRVFDVPTRKLVCKLDGHQNLVTSVAIARDGRRIASGSFDRTVRIWSIDRKAEIDRLQGHSDQVMDVGWLSGESDMVVSAGRDRTVRVWDVTENQEVMRLTAHDAPVNCLCVAPGGTLLGTAAEDGSAILWQVSANTVAGQDRLLGHSDWVRAFAFSSDGRLLASGSVDGSVRLWDVTSHRQVALISDHTNIVHSVAFSPDGRILATGSSDRTLRLRDMDAGRPMGTPTTFESGVASIAFTPDGTTLVVGLYNGVVRLRDVRANREVAAWVGSNPIVSLAISPDGKWFVCGCDDSMVRVVSLPDCTQLAEMPGHERGVASVAVSPDGRWIASGGMDAVVRIWDAATHTEVRRLDGHEGLVLSLDFSPDGRLLASAARNASGMSGGSDTAEVRLWSVADGRELARLRGEATARFSPDGVLLAVARGDGAIRLCGGGIPADPALAARVTGLQRDAFDLRPITHEREQELRSRFAELPTVWYEPDPAAASFWRACHASLREHAGLAPVELRDPDAIRASMRALIEWKAQHPTHRYAEAAAEMITAARDGHDPAAVLQD